MVPQKATAISSQTRQTPQRQRLTRLKMYTPPRTIMWKCYRLFLFLSCDMWTDGNGAGEHDDWWLMLMKKRDARCRARLRTSSPLATPGREASATVSNSTLRALGFSGWKRAILSDLGRQRCKFQRNIWTYTVLARWRTAWRSRWRRWAAWRETSPGSSCTLTLRERWWWS